MSLTRILYVSRMKIFGDDGSMVGRIIETSHKNNARDRIGGILCIGPDCFLQLCEGNERQISALFERISKDDRHENVQILDYRLIKQPLTDRWLSVRVSTDHNGDLISFERIRQMSLRHIYKLLSELYPRSDASGDTGEADDDTLLID